MRALMTLVVVAVLAGCDGPPELPQANGPLLPWNTSMTGIATPLPSPETLPPGMPLLPPETH